MSGGFLVLEDGTVFRGESVGAPAIAFGEAVFTTAMTGYQEVVTDPSFCGQIVCFTAPMVGNYGVADHRSESSRPHARGRRHARGARARVDGLAARALHPGAHRHRHARARPAPARARRDARRRRLAARRTSTRRSSAVRAQPSMSGAALAGARLDHASRTSHTDDGRRARRGRRLRRQALDPAPARGRRRGRHGLPARRRRRHARRRTTASLLSNGPGDPGAARRARSATVRDLLGRVPVLGICLGHQLLALATGLRDLQAARSATAARTTRWSSARPAACSSRARTTASRSRRRGRPARHARVALRRHRRGRSPTRSCARARCSSIPRPGRGRTTPGRSSASGSRRCALPRRDDIHSICLIGSGPIVIGQACEFDYAGCQALKVLRDDGYRTIVVNSNPATIMTDPGFADRTYLEPLDLEGVADVLAPRAARRAAADDGRPDGAQPRARAARGRRARRARRRADRREGRRDRPRRGPRALQGTRSSRAACACPTSRIVTRLDQLDGVGLPAVVRPAFTLGGHGGGFVATPEELAAPGRARPRPSRRSARCSSRSRVRGWDEFELEVVRDRADNVVIVCSIENLDPMGVHTGDSVTVAPQMTLSDEAYQELRDAAVAVIRAVGVDTGGSNIQFARERVHRRAARDRDEPARLALVRARVEGDRLPDREGRREARRRLHARRDPERPHRARRPRASSRRSTTSSSSGRASRSRSSPAPTRRSARR